jgi:hypothetical protein
MTLPAAVPWMPPDYGASMCKAKTSFEPWGFRKPQETGDLGPHRRSSESSLDGGASHIWLNTIGMRPLLRV